MIQSDALSRRPDFIPEKDQDNEDRILLSEDMFVNLMDMDLQDHIAKMDKYDYNVKMALELLLENGPNSLQQDLKDWKLEKHTAGRGIFCGVQNCCRMYCKTIKIYT